MADYPIVASETRLAYLAGIVDGEGWIGMNTNGTAYVIRISVAMCDFRPPRMLRETFGGYIGYKDRLKQPYFHGQRPQAFWQVSSRRAELALLALQPWLVVKAEQAQLALDFRAAVHTRGHAGVSSTSETALDFKRRFHALNRPLLAAGG